MSKKRGNLIDLYLDKAILALIVIAGIALLWFFVLSNPYAVEFKNKKYGPGQLDPYVATVEVPRLQKELKRSPEPVIYNPVAGDFFKEVEMPESVRKLDSALYAPIPYTVGKFSDEQREYVLPEIPEITETKANWIRTAVHLPKEPVSISLPYQSVATDVEDIDFVTVESSFPIEQLFDLFKEAFAGRRIKPEWRDTDLAVPFFAKVQLQRRSLDQTGNWDSWENVKETKINHLSELMEFNEILSDSAHKAELLKVKLKPFDVQKQIVQPVAYDVAASNELWFPPTFHEEFLKLAKKEADMAEREKRESRRKESRRDTRNNREGIGPGGMGPGMMGPGGGMDTRDNRRDSRRTDRRRTDRGKSRAERTTDDVEKDFQDTLLDNERDLARKETLLFWAHDDTITPGSTYQYRIRLGIFNPIAGKNWIRDEAQMALNNQLILWSNYSEPTESVAIPKMVEFFPLDVDTDREKVAKVKVARFYLGKWRSRDFEVVAGEPIGMEVEEEKKQTDDRSSRDYDRQEDELDFETIDYTTGAMLIDLQPVTDWTGLSILHSRDYFEVLYTYNNEDIKHRPVDNRNWPKDLRQLLTEIRESEKAEVVINYSRSGRSFDRGSSPSGPGAPGMMGPGIMGPGMMGPGF